MLFLSCPSNALAIVSPPAAAPAADIKIIVNDKPITLGSNNAYYLDGRLLLPLRLLFEAMGSQVQWDGPTKGIHAERNGKSVDLTLDSALAYIDGNPVNLDTKAIAINGSTYVPLRFVGEAFGGTVAWDQATKTVNIVLPDAAIRPVSDLKVTLNSQVLNFTAPPLIIDNVKYLPLDEFLQDLTQNLPQEYNFSWQKKDDGAYAVMFDGVERMFYADRPLLYVNGAEAELPVYPVTANGQVYMPLKLVEEVLNGTLYYEASTKINYIYVTRAKFKTNFLTTTTIAGILPVNMPSAALNGERILTVSDDPEVISPAVLKKDSAVLWLSNPVTLLGKSAQDHRVFGWHINSMGETLRIGVVIENIGKTILTVSDTKHFCRTTPNSWAEYDVGLPVAEAVLNNSMNATLPTDIKIDPNQRFLLQEFTVRDGNLIGFINDIKVTNNNKQAKGKYRIRVVVSSVEGDLREIDSSPLPIRDGKYHTRGNWPASQIISTTPEYEVDSPQVAYSISNGVTDKLYSGKNSLTNGYSATNNIGHFGATYLVNIPIDNPSGEAKIVRIQLSSRGGVYAGAVKNPDGVFLIPELKAMQGMANLYDYKAPPGKSVLTLEFMHAGGSYLPVAVNISTAPPAGQ